MDLFSASIFSFYMIIAYIFVLWIQFSAWKEFKSYNDSLSKTVKELNLEIISLKNDIKNINSEPKKIIVEQKNLYNLNGTRR